MLTRLILVIALVGTAVPSTAQVSFPSQAASQRNGATAGAYLRVPLERRGSRPAPAQLGMRIAAVQDYRDPLTGRGPSLDRDVIDLRLSGLSRPTLLVAGAPITRKDAQRLNAIGTGEAVAIGGGVLLLLLLVAVAAGSPGPGACPVIDGDRSHCID